MFFHRIAVAVVMTVFVGLQPLPAQTPGLSIVVIEGEGAVNIIQQKTAVRALVEVRDRNNLPVSGASVTFKIGGQGGAALTGGSPTVTVTTNAAGRAALSGGLTPTAPGTVQISVSATYQGLAATAAIAQTVVATVAQAAAITGAAAAGAAAGGGGLGTGAIIGIVAGGAAVAGGAIVASGALSSQQEDGSGAGPPQAIPPPNCVFVVSPLVLTVPIAGGSFGITVSVSPSPCLNPAWIVTLIPSFVSVDRTSVTGSGTVTLTVAPFTPTPNFPSRSGAIGIADTFVEILQPTRPVGALPALIRRPW